jgi:hypothetical protein
MKGLTDHVEHRAMKKGTLVRLTKVRRSRERCCPVALQGESERK